MRWGRSGTGRCVVRASGAKAAQSAEAGAPVVRHSPVWMAPLRPEELTEVSTRRAVGGGGRLPQQMDVDGEVKCGPGAVSGEHLWGIAANCEGQAAAVTER